MNTNVHSIVSAAWVTLPEEDPARIAIAAVQDPEVRDSVAQQDLRPLEFAAFAERNLTQDETVTVLTNAPIAEIGDDVRALAEATRLDRRARRLVFADPAVYATMSPEEQHQLALTIDPGAGRDDFVLAVLPWWLGSDLDFDAAELAPTLGAIAGAHLLASTGPDILSDAKVWDLIQNPPQKWEHSDEDRKWHQRAYVRDAMYMVFTHRPDLARKASTDPDLVQYAMRSPHWEADFAHNIRGFDLESGTLTEDASRNTPGALLSLVWNPKTPLAQAEKIAEIAEEGLTTTPFTDEWTVTAGAAGSRLDVQKWHVDDFATVQDGNELNRLVRRIKRGVLGKTDMNKTLNGYQSTNMLWWPKRFEEGLAMLTNPNVSGRDWESIRQRLVELGSHTAPAGTWTREQFVASGHKLGMYVPPSSPDRGMDVFNQDSARLGKQFTETAAKRFEELDPQDRAEAWGLLLSFAADTDTVTLPPELIDTTMAILA